ncbi:hypothetical protein Pint_02089 [Pistacia integerrima]|uniref:Uncharacterized protein n=1 Tax=Pistacia integerrima TaxID=434235 RepID=A0ACC0ZIA2_9ROSI|nr:hypothetical protein Pint_02089 [Pistacia integerrima]
MPFSSFFFSLSQNHISPIINKTHPLQWPLFCRVNWLKNPLVMMDDEFWTIGFLPSSQSLKIKCILTFLSNKITPLHPPSSLCALTCIHHGS